MRRDAIRTLALLVLVAGCGSAAPIRSEEASVASTPASAPALSATVVATIPLAVFPGGPAVTSDALWFWDDTAGSIVRVDVATDRAVATIPIGDPNATPYGTPKAITANEQTVWVSDDVNHAVARIDPATNKIVERIALDKIADPAVARPVSPFGLALDREVLWVSDFDQGLVLRIDTKTKRVTLVVSNVDHPEGIAVGLGSIWVVEHRLGSIARIDPATGKVVATIALPGTGPDPVCGMCVDSVVTSSDGVWVPLDFGDGVARIDPGTNHVSAEIPLGRVVDSLAVGDRAIWAAGWDGSIPCTDTGASVTRIDEVTNVASGSTTVQCAVTVAVTSGALWVGTADAPNGVTRFDVGP